MRKLVKRKGFTLIELMIVVAIIGILAAMAIPVFIKYQYRSRSAEAPVNMRAIQSAEFSYFAKADVFKVADQTPASNPSNMKASWIGGGGGFDDFQEMGFTVEGTVYFRYAVSAQGACFSVGAVADVDGDSIYQQWADVHPDTKDATATVPFGITVASEYREQVIQVTKLDVY